MKITLKSTVKSVIEIPAEEATILVNDGFVQILDTATDEWYYFNTIDVLCIEPDKTKVYTKNYNSKKQ